MDSETKGVGQASQLATFAGERMDDAEACAKMKRFYPACMMAGTSIEAALLAQVLVFEPELREVGHWKGGDNLLNWTIESLIQGAIKLGWFSAVKSTVPNARITEVLDGETGDAVRFIQYLRNVRAHPGKHVREVSWLTVGENEWELVRGIADVVFGHLHEVLEALPN